MASEKQQIEIVEIRRFDVFGKRRWNVDWREGFDDSRLDEEALSFLIEHELDEKAAGITKRVITHRLGSLSEKQLHIITTYVVDKWLMRKCRCGNHEVEGHELIGLWVNDGYCSRCADRMDKDDRREASSAS